MKKHIISTLLLISLSFQSTYPAFEKFSEWVEKKKRALVEGEYTQAPVSALRNPMKFKRAYDNAQKAFMNCKRSHCSLEMNTFRNAYDEAYVEWIKKNKKYKWLISHFQFYTSKAFKELRAPLTHCEKKYCRKELLAYRGFRLEHFRADMILQATSTLSLMGLLYFAGSLQKMYEEEARAEAKKRVSSTPEGVGP